MDIIRKITDLNQGEFRDHIWAPVVKFEIFDNGSLLKNKIILAMRGEKGTLKLMGIIFLN